MPCRSSTGSASARRRCSSRPSTRRSTTSSAPAAPTIVNSSTTLTDLAGQSQNFDGNGRYAPHPAGRWRPPAQAFESGSDPDDRTSRCLDTHTMAPAGTQPQLGGRPPKKPEVRCDRNPVPDVNGSLGSARRPGNDGGEPMSERPQTSRWRHFRASLSRQSRGRGKDTIAIIVLAIVGDRDDALDLHPAESVAAVLGAARRRRLRPPQGGVHDVPRR